MLAQIAQFLRINSALDKAAVGEYIGKRGNEGILTAYVNTFDLSNLPIDQALRGFLEAFRMPGEAPTIGKIIEELAKRWNHSYLGTSHTCELAAHRSCYLLTGTHQHAAVPPVPHLAAKCLRCSFRDLVTFINSCEF